MISVIIPVYNTKQHLAVCIDSLLAQTYSDFEILLIDDGSSDGSGILCDEYAIRESRIKVVHTSNGGVTAARKIGIEMAIGEWVTFVDSDDDVPCNAFENYAKLFTADTDIIIGQVNANKTDVVEKYAIKDYREGLLNGNIRVDACGKMIKRSIFISSILDIPREIKVGEDMLMHIRLSFFTEKDVYVLPYPNHTYNYRSHEEQCSKTFQRTLDYEEIFHIHLKKSIPIYAWADLLNASIKSRLNALRMVLMNYSMIYGLEHHKFYIELCDDIKKTAYSLSWRDKLFLKAKNNLFRIVLITLVNLYTKFK